MSAVKARNEAVGMAVAGVVTAGVSLIILPLTLALIGVQWALRAVRWVGRKAGASWAQ